MSDTPDIFFQPDEAMIAASAMTDFTAHCARIAGRAFPTYEALHGWSIQQADAFWAALLGWSGIIHGGDPSPTLVGEGVEGARFFPGVELSYVENLLAGARLRGDLSAPAITSCDESGRVEVITWAGLAGQVERLAAGLSEIGVERGDRVVAVVRNAADAIVACLAVTGLGATWSSTAPDMGLEAIVGRFGQLGPRWLVTHAAQRSGGQRVDLGPLVKGLVEALPTLAGVIALDPEPLPPLGAPVHARAALDAAGQGASIRWPRVPFDHPLFTLFSSGTTGAPKCIVHGVGGTLLQHVKEHRLHGDLGPGDTLYFHTTAGWMMWNWLVSALASGVHVVVYDGSIAYPGPDALVRLLERERVTVFGTSPVYLQYLELSGVRPAEIADLSALRLVMSTGAVLYPRHFDFVRAHVKAVPVHSISGGTDIIGCVVLGNPNLPVYRGESPCKALGLDVRVIHGGATSAEGVGELVCCAPFPSRPVSFFGDEGGERLRAAYFAENPGVWTHGDFVELTGRGTARIIGRSDGVLNIKGVRIGPAEIYGALGDVEGLADSMALSAEDPAAFGGRRLILLVVLGQGAALDRQLTLRIKRTLKERCSVNHVPERVIAVPSLPTTHSGKRSERAAQDVLDGRPVRNRHALRNPESLEAIVAAFEAP